MSLWDCHRFLVDDPAYHAELMGRFVAQIRGMGDPLVANYARSVDPSGSAFPGSQHIRFTAGDRQQCLSSSEPVFSRLQSV